jgi:hypothetical protein
LSFLRLFIGFLVAAAFAAAWIGVAWLVMLVTLYIVRVIQRAAPTPVGRDFQGRDINQ